MRQEFQIKVEGNLDVSLLISLGAELLGQVTQKDIYLGVNGKTWRIREEAGQFVFAQKSHDIGKKARVKDVSEKVISKSKSSRLINEHGIRTVVCKNRVLYRLSDIVIALDEVEHLGEFVEIRANNEESLFKILQILGFNETDSIKESYLEMVIAKCLPEWLSTLLHFHEKVGELTFGITSGILTTIGVLTGVNSATGSVLPVIAAIASIAAADSCSDAFGMYMSKVSERGSSKQAAISYALGTLAGKFFFPLTFIIPILLFDLNKGVLIDLIWGGVALALLSAEQAIITQSSVPKSILRNISLAIFIVLISSTVGLMIGKFI